MGADSEVIAMMESLWAIVCVERYPWKQVMRMLWRKRAFILSKLRRYLFYFIILFYYFILFIEIFIIIGFDHESAIPF